MRYFLELGYLGKNFFGWQIQPNQISVQETIEKPLSLLLRENIKITGAGRTDTGVHALQMFAHFDFAAPLPSDLVHRMNRFLPPDIVIYNIHPVRPEAHARFDAEERTYEYRIDTLKNPFTIDSSWQLYAAPDFNKMNEAAALLCETRDFSSFAKTHTDVKTHICSLRKAEWKKEGNSLIFTITADRFLRDMVRAITGTLVDVGKEKISLNRFREIIERKDRRFASGSAPAQGLFLKEVRYPKSVFEDGE